MKCLDKFNKKMQLNGGSIRNELIQNSKNLLQDVFADDTSFSEGIYFWELGKSKDVYINEIPIRLYKKSFSNASGITVKFQTLLENPIVLGDIVYDSNEDEYLICTESYNTSKVHYQGKFTVCNWMLKWQNIAGDILEYPCFNINSTQYNSGEQSNKQFTIGSSQHMVTLPYDENTVVLSSPQRFFLDRNTINPVSYIVTQNDTTSFNYGKKGLVKVTLLECAKNNETDRVDLGICDYVEKKDLIKDNSNNSYIKKSVIKFDTNIIKSGGDLQTFTAKFFNENEKEITDIVPKWDIVCDFKDILIIENKDNQIKIGIDNDKYVDEDFKLILSDIDGNYSSDLVIKVESLL